MVELQINASSELSEIFTDFGNKPFMSYQVQFFPPRLLPNSFKSEEDGLIEAVSIIPPDQVPLNASVISLHTIYTLKVEDDSVLKLKAHIAPHSNEYSFEDYMRSICAMFSLTIICILLSIVALFLPNF